MKSVALFISFILMHFWAGAQSVEATVSHSRINGNAQYVINVSEESESRWQSVHTPELVAYPVDLDIKMDTGKTTLIILGAESITLLIEYGANDAGSTIAGHTVMGSLLWSINLPIGRNRVLVESAPKDIILSVDDNRSQTAGKVRIARVYIEPGSASTHLDLGFGTSDVCHPNAACPENDPWRNQVRSAVRIRMVLEEGIGWCSGTLMNNTARDGTPYILSAEHCLALNTPMWDLWGFDFNYESASCDNPADEPVAHSLTGCSLKSKHRDTDFMLLELDQDVPVSFNPYFSGWNRTANQNPPKIALIHHPTADIKKVSRDRHPTSVWDKTINWLEGYSTPPNTHYRSKLDDGAFQPGSSGGAIYDPDGYVIGQLHGGTGNCTVNTIFSGVLAESWDYGDADARLREYLDPIAMDSLTLEGMEHPGLANTYALQGTITDQYGNPVRDVTLTLTGAVDMSIDVDSTGTFAFTLLPRSDTLVFSARKTSNPTNGVSATDLLLIKQHLLGTNIFTEPHQSLAADATANDIVSASDILFLQKLLLGILQFLPTQDSWIFAPSEIMIENPTGPDVSIEFTAIKVGDVNGTADPGK